jgi:arginine repressor
MARNFEIDEYAKNKVKKSLEDKIENRHNAIKSLVIKQKIYKQEDIVSYIKKEKYDLDYSQSQCSRDLSSIGLTKSKNGYYRKSKKAISAITKKCLAELIPEYVLDIFETESKKEYFITTLRISRGYETLISELLLASYPSKIIGITQGNKVISILYQSEETAKKIVEFIKSSIRKDIQKS